jgi:hypothetical protein
MGDLLGALLVLDNGRLRNFGIARSERFAAAHGHYLNGLGCYSTFTDRDLADVVNPRSGEFRNVVSGLFAIKKHVVTFTLLTNDPKSREAKQALQIISDGITLP